MSPGDFDIASAVSWCASAALVSARCSTGWVAARRFFTTSGGVPTDTKKPHQKHGLQAGKPPSLVPGTPCTRGDRWHWSRPVS